MTKHPKGSKENNIILFIPNASNNHKQTSKDCYYIILDDPLTIRRTTSIENHLKLSGCEELCDITKSLPVESQANESGLISFGYDQELFQHSAAIDSSGCFKLLHGKIKDVNLQKPSMHNAYKNTKQSLFQSFIMRFYMQLHMLLKHSHWFSHMEHNINLMLTAFAQRKSTNGILLKNIYSAKVIDFLLGVLVLYYILEYKPTIMDTILHSTQFIIDALKTVLNTLMDSPAGLKLNYALNQTLAIFFFYHITLWRAFVQNIMTVSSSVVYIYAVLGSFGLSFQIALITDVIVFLTFHVYCIYVYAARFYRVQIYTITSLWRLFIGRKYNPLKLRVDSFQYTRNQLFVGTLGFTVLLFLLPTTFLYYIVFTVFRLWVLTICKMLEWITNCFCSLPLYLLYLRVSGSSKIKGEVYICTKKNTKDSTIRLHVMLNELNTWFRCQTIKKTLPTSSLSFKEYFNYVCTGKLL